MSDDNMVTVEIEVDSELLHQVEEILKPYGLTPEAVAVMFFKFCANPATQEQAVALLTKWRDEQAALDRREEKVNREGCCTLAEVNDYRAEKFAPKNIVYLTGDTHGEFDRVISFCERQQVEPENTFIILGDAGLNFWGDRRDASLKEKLSKVPVTFFCIHGNHEQRPSPALGYEMSEYHSGQVWVQHEYPNILFAIDGEVYDFCGHSCLVIGGAYSVDKQYRLARGFGWWPDEQPSQEVKDKVERVIDEHGWVVDAILSHTCPFKYEPREVFLPGIDQSEVDDSTEKWLGGIECRTYYTRWYCGHFHTDKKIDKLRFMFQDFEMLPEHFDSVT